MKQGKVSAIVVTHNRFEKLIKTLEALREQTVELRIIVVDSNSSYTNQEKKIIDSYCDKYFFLQNNYGGAGGFEFGLRYAYKKTDASFFWLMDDDVIPSKTALKELLHAAHYLENHFSFLSSQVTSENGNPMNVPAMTSKSLGNSYSDVFIHLQESLVKIKESTFVSFFCSRKLVEAIGYPFGSFFIWGDDVEFCLRSLNYGPAYLVGKSCVTHLRDSEDKLDIKKITDSARVPFLFYFFRNKHWIKNHYKTFLEAILSYGFSFWMILRAFSPDRLYFIKLYYAIKGILASIIYRPNHLFEDNNDN